MLLLVAVALCSCTKEVVIVVENRWWEAHTLVQYTDTDVTITTNDDGYPSANLTTTTVTKCRASNTGAELPESYPLPACDLHNGDYISYRVYCYVVYHEQECNESITSSFPCQYWAELEPRSEATVKILMNTILSAERMKR